MSACSSSLSRMPFISALVRRSTKRCVSCSCSASDSAVLDRARALLPVGRDRRSQSARLETNVQVRMCAMRLASVSMSPSVRSARATCLANQSSGMRSLGDHQELVERGDQLGVVLRRRSCGSRGSGRRPTAVATAAGATAMARDLADRALTVSSAMHVVGHARARQALLARHLAQAVAQALERREVELAVAPLQRRARCRRCASPAAR